MGFDTKKYYCEHREEILEKQRKKRAQFTKEDWAEVYKGRTETPEKYERTRKRGEDWRLKNLDYNREYFEAHKEEILANTAQWRKNNKERIRKVDKIWRDGNKERIQVNSKKHYEEIKKTDPTYYKNIYYRNMYGITLEQKEQLILVQDNKCAICETPFASTSETHVDHDHKTGQVRAILCGNCNRGLGHFKEDPTLIDKARQYLEKH